MSPEELMMQSQARQVAVEKFRCTSTCIYWHFTQHFVGSVPVAMENFVLVGGRAEGIGEDRTGRRQVKAGEISDGTRRSI